MNNDAFTKPNGKIVESTFQPKLLPPQIFYDEELVGMITKAGVKIGELKGIAKLLKRPQILIHRYLREEAVVSSKIEGTMASIQDVFQYEAMKNINKSESQYLRLQEVLNYTNALDTCLKEIRNEDKRITLYTIKTAHKILMSDVRGGDKQPGKIRTIQNWIGSPGQTIQNSIYIPPAPKLLDDLLENFVDFLHNPPKHMSVLVQCAIMHYQFEAMHPFQDGNGRIGRMLISLLLAEKGVLEQPLLYISAYFEKNSDNYYKGLLAVSQKSKWKEWLKLFMHAIMEQADLTIQNITTMLELEQKYKNNLDQINASSNAYKLLDCLFENHYITIPRVQKLLSIQYPSAKNVVQTLIKAKILERSSIPYRSKVFYAREIGEIMM